MYYILYYIICIEWQRFLCVHVFVFGAHPTRCLTSDAEKGLTIGQMVDKQIADLQDKVTRLEQALCSERGLREAADQKFRDAVQSLEGKAGDSVMLQKVFLSADRACSSMFLGNSLIASVCSCLFLLNKSFQENVKASSVFWPASERSSKQRRSRWRLDTRSFTLPRRRLKLEKRSFMLLRSRLRLSERNWSRLKGRLSSWPRDWQSKGVFPAWPAVVVHAGNMKRTDAGTLYRLKRMIRCIRPIWPTFVIQARAIVAGPSIQQGSPVKLISSWCSKSEVTPTKFARFGFCPTCQSSGSPPLLACCNRRMSFDNSTSKRLILAFTAKCRKSYNQPATSQAALGFGPQPSSQCTALKTWGFGRLISWGGKLCGRGLQVTMWMSPLQIWTWTFVVQGSWPRTNQCLTVVSRWP